jgi:hypothetical protein
VKGSMQTAAAIGVGYLLGRNRKFRTAALMAAGAAMGGGAVGGPIVRQGTKILGSAEVLEKVTPQLSALVDVVRGDLVSAGKAAATAAVSNRVDALTDSLHDRAERVRNVGAAAEEGADKAAEAGQTAAKAGGRAAGGTAKRAGSTVGDTARRPTGRGKAEAEADEVELDDYEPDDHDSGGEDERDEYEDNDVNNERDEYEDNDVAEDEADEPPPRRRSATTRRSPVTRTGR